MPLISRQQGPIAVYGATGYTGRLVAAELADAKAELIVSGRNRRKLDVLAAELEGDITARQATLDDPASLRQLLASLRARWREERDGAARARSAGSPGPARPGS